MKSQTTLFINSILENNPQESCSNMKNIMRDKVGNKLKTLKKDIAENIISEFDEDLNENEMSDEQYAKVHGHKAGKRGQPYHNNPYDAKKEAKLHGIWEKSRKASSEGSEYKLTNEDLNEETFKFVGYAANSPYGYEKEGNRHEFTVKAKNTKHANDKAIKVMHGKYPDHTHHKVELAESDIAEDYSTRVKANTKFYKSIVKKPRIAKSPLYKKELEEKHMTSSEKKKEEKLKDKYDPSEMKQKMIDQYGPEKGKSVYFATIRKQAMGEDVENIDESVRLTTLKKHYNTLDAETFKKQYGHPKHVVAKIFGW